MGTCVCLFVCLFVDAEQEGGMNFNGKCAYCIESKLTKTGLVMS